MLFLGVTLLAITSNTVLGLMTFNKNPHSYTGRLFLILTVIFSLWGISNYFSIVNTDPQTILFWIRVVMFITAAMFPALYLLTRTFPYDALNLPRIYLLPIAFIIVAAQFLSLTPYVFQKVEITNGVVNPVPGPAIAIFAFNFIGFFLLTLRTLWQKNRQLKGLEKIQLRYFILGIGVTFSLMLITNFLLVNFAGITFFVALGPLFTLILVGFISYAIIKHRFMDIRFVVARSVSYTLLVLVLGAFYAAGLFIASTLVTKQSTSSSNLVTSTILALIIAFSFQTVLHFLERVTDSIFYKNHYNPQQLLTRLGNIMSATIDLSELTELLLNELISEMKISNASLLLIRQENVIWSHNFGNTKQVEYDEKKVKHLVKQALSKQIDGKGDNLLIFEEIPESNTKDIMRDNNINVVLPLVVEHEIIGVIFLSEKSSGDIYSEEDINIFNIFGQEAAIAVKNSLSYEEIRKFNITLSREVERATSDLKAANTRLKELDELKDDFVSVTSHELRTPMTAIRSYIWMALYRSDIPLSEKMNRYLTRVLISTERLINLVNDMLNVSRIESGRIEINPQVFDLRGLVNDVILEINPKALEKRIKIDLDQDQVPQVFADPDKVHQVLLNLLGNALKFTMADGLIKISFFTDGQVVETSIKDNGVGIARDDLSRLFQKFSRLDSSYIAAATSGGTGLGLYIAKSLVTLMKGKIWASSEGLGKGTTFTFSLPIAAPRVLAEAAKYTHQVAGEEVRTLEPVAI